MNETILALRDATPATSGGKASILAQLMRAGIDVPDGFVIPVSEYRRHHPERHNLDGLHLDGDTADGDTVEVEGEPRPPDARLVEAIAGHLRRLLGGEDAGFVAVRSSGTGEDGAASSAAGQHDSFLAVRGTEAVAAAVARCWASLHSPRAIAYRSRQSTPADEPPAMAVLVQQLVDPDVSGVLFTRAQTQTTRVIEATLGLAEPLVSGQITPDSWTIDDTGIITRRTGVITHRLDRRGDRLHTTPLLASDGLCGDVRGDRPHTTRLSGSGQPCLDDATVLDLDRLGARIATILGYPADIEWAIEGDRIHTIQARPITAHLPPPDEQRPDAPELLGEAPIEPGVPVLELHERGAEHDGRQRPGQRTRGHETPGSGLHVQGIPASPGSATGPTRVLVGPKDFHRMRPGDIIVCRATDPAWTPLFAHADGIITETGGLLSHAAIVARELGIPAILSVPDATTIYPDGTRITMDGATAHIHRESTG